MKFRRFVGLVTTVAWVASGLPGLRAGASAAAPPAGPSAAQQVPQVQVTPASAQGITGTVLQSDRQTLVPDRPVQLRRVDTGTIVGRTVSDQQGAFSFAVPEPGLYVAEVVSRDGGIVAVGDPVPFVGLPILTTVILPSSNSQMLWVLLALAGTAGVVGLGVAQGGTVSPEL